MGEPLVGSAGPATSAWGRLLACLVVLWLGGAGLLGCGAPQPPARELTALEILESSSSAMSRLTSLHFRLDVVNGTMYLGPNMVATSMEGDVVGPDRLQLLLKARMGNTPIEFQAVTVGSRSFLTNPLNHQWQDASGSLAVPGILDPAHGIGATLRQVASPERLGLETVDGVECYHLRGSVPASALAALSGSQESAPSAAAIDLWVGTKDFRLRQARLVGAILPEESPLLERSLKLSDFDKPTTIEAPIP